MVAPRWSQGGSRWPKVNPRWFQNAPNSRTVKVPHLTEQAWGPNMASREPQGGSKMASRWLKMAQGEPRMPPKNDQHNLHYHQLTTHPPPPTAPSPTHHHSYHLIFTLTLSYHRAFWVCQGPSGSFGFALTGLLWPLSLP